MEGPRFELGEGLSSLSELAIQCIRPDSATPPIYSRIFGYIIKILNFQQILNPRKKFPKKFYFMVKYGIKHRWDPQFQRGAEFSRL